MIHIWDTQNVRQFLNCEPTSKEQGFPQAEEISLTFLCAFIAQNIESAFPLDLVYMLNQRVESFRENYKH